MYPLVPGLKPRKMHLEALESSLVLPWEIVEAKKESQRLLSP
jgi:hypothetical protein